MDKHSVFRGSLESGAPLIHRVEPGTRYGLDKTASLPVGGEHLPEVQELVESLSPQPGRIYLVNASLASGEYVGFNMRGDWFNEAGLTHTPPGWDRIPVWDIEARRRAASYLEPVDGWGHLAWGYPTFYNACKFRHHKNDDPNRAHGYILGAFWDPRMHRVILVSELIEQLCAAQGALDLYTRIENGELVDTSMGSKVPFDQCSVCGHIAPTPESYCEHVRKDALPPYGMNALLPDGRRCGVYNPYMRFHDDSCVLIGAERTAKHLARVHPKGTRAYTDTRYGPGEGRWKVAGIELDRGPGAPLQEGESKEDQTQREEELADAVRRVRHLPDQKVGDRLSRVLAGQPLRPLPRRTPPRETPPAPPSLPGPLGVVTQQAEALRKEGSLLKWAEIFKRLPVPKAHDLALLRQHEARPVIPPDLLCRIPDRGLGTLFDQGIVLRPDEFQYRKLWGQDPALADACWNQRVGFRCPPLTEEIEPDEYPPAPDLIPLLLELLAPVFARKGASDTTVVIRITDHPRLDAIGHAYNRYRVGGLLRIPDLLHVPVGDKIACDRAMQTSLTLGLAFWPVFGVGYTYSGQARSAEDAHQDFIVKEHPHV